MFQLQAAYSSKMFSNSSEEVWRVVDVMNRLLVSNPEMRSNLPFDQWKVFVVDDPLVNACALPVSQI